MLKNSFAARLTWFVIAAACLMAFACSQEGTESTGRVDGPTGQPEGTPPAELSRRVVIGEGAPPLWLADSLGEMVTAYDRIVVGEVVDAKDISCPEGTPPKHEDSGESPPSGNPKAKSTPVSVDCHELPSTATLFSVRVIRSFRPNVNPGALLSVGQIGGIKDSVEYGLEGDRVMGLGDVYLFFLHPADPSDPDSPLESAPFGRFLIDASGKLAPVDETWNYLRAVEELKGRTLDEADVRVDAAAAEHVPIEAPSGPN